MDNIFDNRSVLIRGVKYEIGQWILTNESCIFSYLEGEIIGFNLSDYNKPKIIVNLRLPSSKLIKKSLEKRIERYYGVDVKLSYAILRGRYLDIDEFDTEFTTKRYVEIKDDFLVKHYNCKTPKGYKCKKDRLLEKNKSYKIADTFRNNNSDELIYRLVDDKKYSYFVKVNDVV